MVLTAADMLGAPDEPEENEAAEPKIEATPRFTRAVFSYLEPRVGIDGKSGFRTCMSCQNYVPEPVMTGAVMGSRCAILGSAMAVTDDQGCDRWIPWSAGAPCDHIVMMNAGEMRRGVPPAISTYSAGFSWDKDTKRQCGNCRFANRDDPETVKVGKIECEAFECMNACSPNLFALDTTVDPYGGCSLFQKPPDEPPGYL